MNSDAIERAYQQLTPFVDNHISEQIAHSLQFLALLRGSDGGWGRVQGARSTIRASTAALTVFASHRSYLKHGEFEDSLEFLCSHLAWIGSKHKLHESGGKPPSQEVQHTNDTDVNSIEDIANVAILLSTLDLSSYDRLQSQFMKYLIKDQHSDGGWGEGVSRVDVTARALIALSNRGDPPSRMSLKRGQVFLESVAHLDGGWGLFKEGTANVIHTAHALTALLVSGSTSSVMQKALAWLRSEQNDTEGYWGQGDFSDVVYATATCLAAILSYGISKTDPSVRRAVKFLFGLRNPDYGWGWSPEELSEVEPTAVVLDALVTAGIEEYVPISAALDVLRNEFEVSRALRVENESILKDIDATVQTRIQNVLSTKDDLEKKVTQLEAENRRYLQQQRELQQLRREIAELGSARAERIMVQRLLSQALQILAEDFHSSAEQLLVSLEEIISENDGVLTLAVRHNILPNMLMEILTIPFEVRGTFARSYLERLSGELPLGLASDITTLIGALPANPSTDVEKEIIRLARRLEAGEMIPQRIPRASSLSSALRELEIVLDRIAVVSLESADEIVSRLERALPELHPSDVSSFLEWLVSRTSLNLNLPEGIQADLRNAISKVVGSKRTSNKTLLRTRLRRLRSQYAKPT